MIKKWHAILTLVVCASCHQSVDERPTETKPLTHDGLVKEYFNRFNAHDWKAMTALYADSVRMKDPAFGFGVVKLGRNQIEHKYAELAEAIQDIHDDVQAVYNAGDHVVVEFISSGTAPDGNSFRLPICTIFEIHDQKITADFTYYDNFDQ